jgi:uncharacterized membrane protein YedE/YeeE
MTSSYGLSLLGGVIIGAAISLVLFTHGRVAGISGLFGGIFLPGQDARSFRLCFVAGLVGAGVLLSRFYPAAFSSSATPTVAIAAIAGVLVGYGTRLGGGCTSGHGICGISRLSVRSVVATITFIAAGMVTVLVVKHLTGGAG